MIDLYLPLYISFLNRFWKENKIKKHLNAMVLRRLSRNNEKNLHRLNQNYQIQMFQNVHIPNFPNKPNGAGRKSRREKERKGPACFFSSEVPLR